MSFAAPLFLLFFLAIPLAVVLYAWRQARRQRYAVRFTNLELLANVASDTPGWRRHIPPVLMLAALGALFLGLARPEVQDRVPKEEATILLVIDISGSMRATDVKPTRLVAAQTAGEQFITG